MNTSTRIRVLIHCREAGIETIRTLVSLSGQSVGSRRLNITLASTEPESHSEGEARRLYAALDFNSLEVMDARGLSPAQALNLAAEGLEDHILLLDNGTRLSPYYIARCLEALDRRKADAATSAHTGPGADRNPLERLKPFSPDRLVRMNPLGPAALIRREAWEELDGLRTSLALFRWDFWLRLAMAGGVIAYLSDILASAPATAPMPPARDGHAKAMLVVSSPGAFEPAVCRWALAHLRGEAWATSFESGRIPGQRDVDGLFARQPMPGATAVAGSRTGTA